MAEAEGSENLGLKLTRSPSRAGVTKRGCGGCPGTADPCRHFLSSQRTMAQKQVQLFHFPIPWACTRARFPQG